MSEEDFLNYRMIEKNPALYLENPEIRRYMRMLAPKRVGQAVRQQFLGCGDHGMEVQGYLPYYLAAEAPAKNESSGGS